MSEAPERIWADMDGCWWDKPYGESPEYVRCDMLQEIFARYSRVEADRIEELEVENENLKANLTHLRQTCQRAWDKCDEERVKLAKAMEALKEGMRCTSEHGGAAKFLRIARTTLAEIKGEKG